MVKRRLVLFLSIVMIISIFPNIVFAAEFSDMPSNWSTVGLENAVTNGLLKGYDGKLRPDDNLTRAEMATIVNRGFGQRKKASISQYTDVSEDDWYYDEMAKAVEMGIFVGHGNRLNSDKSITREETFIVLSRALNLGIGSESSLDKFSDKGEVSQWAKEGVDSLVSAGYISGSNGKLNPKENITRAEFAKVMDNLIKMYINKEGTYTTISNGNVMVCVANVTLKDLTVNGDLIIGPGVGYGNIILDNVTVTGRILIVSGSNAELTVSKDSKVDTIILDSEKSNVKIFGEINKINITEKAEGSAINVLKGSKVGNIEVNAKETTIYGEGSVKKVEVKANNVKVNTPGTKVIVAKGITGVTANGKDISGGASIKDVDVGREDIIPSKDYEDNKDNNGESEVKSDLTIYNRVLKAVVKEDYTTDSWEIYQGVVKANIVTTQNSQGEVDAATAKIKEAQANLVKKIKSLVLSIDVVEANVLIGYDKVKVTLNVDNPKDYKVGSSELSEFVYNPKDGTFTGVVKTGTKAEELFVTEKVVKVEAKVVNVLEFLPGVYDVHVILSGGSPEDYKVSYYGKEFKLNNGVFIGPSHTNLILVEDFVIVKK